MLHELRVYQCAPGRMSALLKRFENVTLALFKKHNIRTIGFWTTVIGESNHHLHYIVAWDSFDEREKTWAAFGADPEWLTKKAESERDGVIVTNVSTTLLRPTNFSPAK